MAMTETTPPERDSRLRSHDALKRMFARAEEVTQRARTLSRRDRRYYDNFDDDQWEEDEKQELRRRGQPIVTDNRISRKIDFLIGHEQRTRTDPRAYPRNPQDEDAANVVTDVLDYIETELRFDKTASACFKDMCIAGIEAVEVYWNGEEIKADRIDEAKFFYDPRSRETDFSDARYLGYSDWYDLEEAQELFPGHEDELEAAMDLSSQDEGFEDKPWCHWGDETRKRVRVNVVYYRISGGWAFAYYTGGGVLREGVSPYVDEKGRPDCPIIAQSAYVTQDNERYGLVRDLIPLQREVNFRRSMALYLMRNRRMYARKDVFQDPARAKSEAAKADGLVEAEGIFGQDWGFIDSTAEIAGNFELLADAKAGIEAQGPNAGLQGRGVEGQSGRAIIAQQNAGLTEENSVFDNHNDWKLRVYRSFWFRAKQFWSSPMYIRVTDDEKSMSFTQVNVPVVDAFGQPVGVQNQLAQMDVDIIIEAMPDTLTLQFEQFEQLAALAQSGVPIPPDVLVMASQLRDKRQIIERLEQAQQQQAQAAQMQMQADMQERAASIAKTQAETDETRVDTAKTQLETARMAVTPIVMGG